jgi:hypothetical protein
MVMRTRMNPRTAERERLPARSKLFRHWLLDHLAKEDMLLKPALSGKPV